MSDFYGNFPYNWYLEPSSFERIVEDIHEINFYWKLIEKINTDEDEMNQLESTSPNEFIEFLKTIKALRQVDLIKNYREHITLKRDHRVSKKEDIISIVLKKQIKHKNAAHIPLRVLKEYGFNEKILD
jgi:hypothetical protein